VILNLAALADWMEATLGLVILYLVGILGTLPPGSHE
jgi:hypothetical protein